MKECTFTLEFITHVLANGLISNNDVSCFQRDGSNNLVWQQSWWHSAFTKAIALTKIRGIKASDIHVDLIIPITPQIYKRKYGNDKYRLHEAIFPNTRVTFNAVVADHITEATLNAILDKMGKYVGISPYGYNLGYGKFNVISIKVAPGVESNNISNLEYKSDSAKTPN